MQKREPKEMLSFVAEAVALGLDVVRRVRFIFIEAVRRTMRRGISEIRFAQSRKLAAGGLWIGPVAKESFRGRIDADDKVSGLPSLKHALVFALANGILVFGGYFAARAGIIGSNVTSLNVLKKGVKSVSVSGGTKPNAESGVSSRRDIASMHARPAESNTPSLISADYIARARIDGAGVSTATGRKNSTSQDSGAQTTTENVGVRSQYDIAAMPPTPYQSAMALPSSSPTTQQQSSPTAEPNVSSGAVWALAMQGNAAAQYELAISLFRGTELQRDAKGAARWLEKAANQGLATAQLRLGILYGKGVGVNRDYALARKWFQAAAENGNALAMHNLAVLLTEGNDRKPDYTSAAAWLRRAAELGVLDSQYNLGIYYVRGLGVDKNLVQSYAWFATAAARGDAKASQKRKDVAALLAPEERVAAKALADRFKRRQPLTEASE